MEVFVYTVIISSHHSVGLLVAALETHATGFASALTSIVAINLLSQLWDCVHRILAAEGSWIYFGFRCVFYPLRDVTRLFYVAVLRLSPVAPFAMHL